MFKIFFLIVYCSRHLFFLFLQFSFVYFSCLQYYQRHKKVFIIKQILRSFFLHSIKMYTLLYIYFFFGFNQHCQEFSFYLTNKNDFLCSFLVTLGRYTNFYFLLKNISCFHFLFTFDLI